MSVTISHRHSRENGNLVKFVSAKGELFQWISGQARNDIHLTMCTGF